MKFNTENKFDNRFDSLDFKDAKLLYELEPPSNTTLLKEHVQYTMNKSLKFLSKHFIGNYRDINEDQLSDQLNFNINRINEQFDVVDDSLKFDSLIESGNLTKVYQKIWVKFGDDKWKSEGYDYSIEQINDKDNLYRLRFKIKTDDQVQPKMRCQLAFCRPINYTSIIKGIVKHEEYIFREEQPNQDLKFQFFDEQNSLYYQRDILCYTASQIPVLMIKISDSPVITIRKKYVFICSRVHSSETHVSQIFDGIYQSLMTNDTYVLKLRKQFIFVLIPCLNPDGVVLGNSRVNACGYDLNRQWESPDADLHPEIYHMKRLMSQCNSQLISQLPTNPLNTKKIMIFCDIHCHTKKLNSFFYGCNTVAKGGITSWTKTRLFPRIMAKNNLKIRLKECNFKVTEDKLGTGRVVAWDEFGITNSFTFENSYFGYRNSDGSIVQYTKEDYRELGSDFVKSMYEFQIVSKQLEKELIESKGWLRPHKLLEVTGETALDKAKKKVEKQKQMQERQINIQQYQEIMKNETYYQMLKSVQQQKQTRKMINKSNNISSVQQDLINDLTGTPQQSTNLKSSRQNHFTFQNIDKLTPKNTKKSPLVGQQTPDVKMNKDNKKIYPNQSSNNQQVPQPATDLMKIHISLKNNQHISIGLNQFHQQQPNNIQEDQFTDLSSLLDIQQSSQALTQSKDYMTSSNQSQMIQEIKVSQGIKGTADKLKIKVSQRQQDSMLIAPSVDIKIRKKAANAQDLVDQSKNKQIIQNEEQNEEEDGEDDYASFDYDWRQYFSVDEIKNAIDMIEHGREPIDIYYDNSRNNHDSLQQQSRNSKNQCKSQVTHDSTKKKQNEISIIGGGGSYERKNLTKSKNKTSQKQTRLNKINDKAKYPIEQSEQTQVLNNSGGLDQDYIQKNRVKLKPLAKIVNSNIVMPLDPCSKQSLADFSNIPFSNDYNNSQSILGQDILKSRQIVSNNSQLSKIHNRQQSQNDIDVRSENTLNSITATPQPEMKFQISVKRINQAGYNSAQSNTEQSQLTSNKIDKRHRQLSNNLDYQDQGILNNNIKENKLLNNTQHLGRSYAENSDQKYKGVKVQNLVVNQKQINSSNQIFFNILQNNMKDQPSNKRDKTQRGINSLIQSPPKLIVMQGYQNQSILSSIEVKSYNIPSQNGSLGNTRKKSINLSRSHKIQDQIQLNSTVYIKEQYPLFPIMNNDKQMEQRFQQQESAQLHVQQQKIKSTNKNKNSNMAFCTMFFKQSPNGINSLQYAQLTNIDNSIVQHKIKRLNKFRNSQQDPSNVGNFHDNQRKQLQNNQAKYNTSFNFNKISAPKDFTHRLSESQDFASANTNQFQKNQSPAKKMSLPLVNNNARNQALSQDNKLQEFSNQLIYTQSASNENNNNKSKGTTTSGMMNIVNQRESTRQANESIRTPKRKIIITNETPRKSTESKLFSNQALNEYHQEISNDDQDDSKLRKQIQEIMASMKKGNVKRTQAQVYIGKNSRQKNFTNTILLN